jgi:hypothetical protein
MPSMLKLILAVAALVALTPGTAAALEVLSPRDGDTVPSRPTFTFDFTEGSAEIEAATKPELRTAGDRVGDFVESVDSEFFLLPESTGTTWGPLKFNAGRYFWHAKLNDYATLGTPPVWTPVRTFTVRDEPVIIEGWLLRAKRLKGVSKQCPRRVRFRGKAAYDDNSRNKDARWKLTVKAGGRTVKRFRGKAAFGVATFSVIACTKARKFGAALVLTDPAGHTTPAPAKTVKA